MNTKSSKNTKNSKKIISTVLTAIIVISILTAIAPVSANNGVTPEQKNESIAKGLAWLAQQQDVDPTSPTYGAVLEPGNPSYYPVSLTAFAVLKWSEHAKKFTPYDPFDPDYEYSANIEAGLDYIFTKGYDIEINMEHSTDNPDGDGDWRGIYFVSDTPDKRPIYETGIVMMALEATCHPDDRFGTGTPPYLTASYGDIMQDLVDYVSWAQRDTGWGRGGWRYAAHDDGVYVPPGLTHGGADNSVSQFPVLGLMSAKAWGIDAPPWVLNRSGPEGPSGLCNHWLNYSQSFPKPPGDGCFGYSSSAGGSVAMTAAGLTELTYCGVTTDDPRWEAGRECICEKWYTSNIGNLYAMYGVMKAAMTAQPDPLYERHGWFNCTKEEHEWQPEYDQWLNESQNDEGYWPPSYGSTVLGTEFALLILQKVAPKRQNPLWHEINEELDALMVNVSAADMPNIIKQRLIDKLEYAKELKENAKIVCEEDNFDAATKKLGVAKSQVESFASMVRITRRISEADKASFLAESAKIITKIDELIEYIETEHRC